MIGVLDQLDVRRRCWKVGQIVIKERSGQNSAMYNSCFHLYALRFMLPKMNFGLSVLQKDVEPATDYYRYAGVVDTIKQLLMVNIVECNCQIEHGEYSLVSRLFS